MADASYSLVIHRRARAELDALHPAVAEDLREKLIDASQLREPSSMGCVEHVVGRSGLLKVHGDGVRAICHLDSPQFRVLLVDKRRVVYDRLDVAVERAQDADL